MMRTTSMMRLVALLSLLLSTVTASKDALTISNESCNNWDVTSFSYSCGGSSGECNLGDKLQVSGTVDVPAFTTGTVNVDLQVTTFGFTVASINEDICNIIKSDAVECGEAGTYSFETDVDIPSENALTSALMSFTGNYVTVKAKIGSIATCSARVNKVSSSSSMTMVATSAVVGTLLVGAAVYGVRRQRRVIQDENLKKTLTDFEMAPDIGARVAAV